ncbi:MAG: hypothetical protein ACKN9V_03820 [Pseudomonadota bacterium]
MKSLIALVLIGLTVLSVVWYETKTQKESAEAKDADVLGLAAQVLKDEKTQEMIKKVTIEIEQGSEQVQEEQKAASIK